MGEEAKINAAVKKTQESLGKFLKKPPLTEKLLKKPPFRFLHDIVSAVIKQHGLMEGLFTAEELVSDNVKERERKIIFLQKVIDTIALVTGENLAVKPSKMVAGQEADRTNELLQAIASALERKLDSTAAVQQINGSGKPTNGEAKGSKSRNKSKDPPAVNGKSPPRKRDGSKEDKAKAEKREKPRHRDVKKLSGDDQKQSPKKKKEVKETASPKQSKEPQAKIEIAETPPTKNDPAPETENFAPSAPELSPKEPIAEAPKNGSASREKSPGLQKDDALEDTTQVLGQSDEEPKPSSSKDQQQGSVVMPPRPASTRPASAKPRPVTARPAAPRLKERIVKPATEEPEQAQETQSEESKTFALPKDEEEDNDFLVEETPAEPQETVPENVMSASEIAALAEGEQPHGRLVSQILGTKRELETSLDVLPDVEMDGRGRDAVRQEMGRLRNGLQGVVRAVNPLARLLDFLQEDVESMQLELEQWNAATKQARTRLQAERRFTEETLLPLHAQLAELDKKLEQQEQLNTVLRTNILLNEQKMRQRLGH